MKSYYEILEVSEKASNEVIEKAYKVLAKKNHPDLQNGEDKNVAEENMKKINEAYEILSDETKRQEYDKSLEQKKQQELIDEVKKYNNIYSSSQNMGQQSNYNDSIQENSSNNIQNHRSDSGTYTIYYTHINKRSKFRNIIALIVFIIILGIIMRILWAIPPLRIALINIYNENEGVKLIVDVVLKVIKVKW